MIPTLIHLATAARAQGDRCAARRLFEDALAAVPGHRHPPALHGLAELAAEEGDPNGARRLLEEALDVCRRGDDRSATAQVLRGLGQLARAEGDLKRSAVLQTEALELSYQIGRTPEVVASLESMGALAALSGRHEQAVRTFGATQALRDTGGYVRPPWKSAGFEGDVTLARDALGTDGFRTALTEGAALSLAEAVGPFRRVRGRRDRPASGWPSLTDGERRVADLVADGLTNPEIAQRLYISLSTVKTHLSHIFSKLGVAGRTDLAREVRIRRSPPCPPSRVGKAGEL